MSIFGSDVEILRGLPLFQGLTPLEMSEIESRFLRRTYPPRTALLQESQRCGCVYIILRGGVKVFVSRPDGMEMLLTVLGRGEVLGEMSAIDGLAHSASVATVETTDLAWMDETAFNGLLAHMPLLSLNLVRTLSERLRRVTSQAQALATLDASGRVARQLLLFGQQYGEPLPGGGTIIPIRLKQGDLAGMVGASREKVNRILGHFKSQGYISITSESYTVIQRAEPLSKMLR